MQNPRLATGACRLRRSLASSPLRDVAPGGKVLMPTQVQNYRRILKV
jgi:hypothetical protein